MKKGIIVTLALVALISITACGSKSTKNNSKETKTVVNKPKEIKVDFPSAEEYEKALKQGEDTVGKAVTFKVVNVVPDGALGYTVWAGEHLNFISTDVLGWKTEETHTVKVVKVTSATGSFMITFKVIK